MQSRRRVLWVALAVAFGLALRSVSDARGFRRYLQLRREVSLLGERKAQLLDENRRLGEEIRAIRDDPEAIERAAREELGFIKPGEVVINLE